MATETEVIRYPSFRDLILGFPLAIVILAGCAELPVPIRAPYGAAPPSYSAPWRPPPAVAANLAQARAAPTVTATSSSTATIATPTPGPTAWSPHSRSAWPTASG